MMKLITCALAVTAAVANSFSIANAANEMTLGDLKEICAGADNESGAACRFFIYGAQEGITLGNL
jgi:hypothetical protein